MSLDSIKAVTFDVFGTVVDWRTSVARETRAIVGDSHDIDWFEFAARWRSLYQPAMEEIRSGRRGYTILDTLHRENLDQVLEHYGLEDLDATTRDEINRAWHRLTPWPDVVEGLHRLKTRYIIGSMSNGNIALIVNMAKFAQLPWDVVLGAEISRAYKPAPDAYLNSAAALGLEPEQMMLVAAHNNDLEAASAVGFRTAFVARPFEHGPGQTVDTRAERDWDVVAEDFGGVASELGV